MEWPALPQRLLPLWLDFLQEHRAQVARLPSSELEDLALLL